jgi:hypothetical protein
LQGGFPPLGGGPPRRMGCAGRHRGGASLHPKGRSNLLSAPLGPRESRLSRGGKLARLVSPAHPREGVDEGEGEKRFVPSSCRTRNEAARRSVPVHRRIAETGSTPSGSEKRATCDGRVESPPDRKGAREREPDRQPSSNVQACGSAVRQKGDGPSGSGDPHHVSAVVSGEATRVRSGFGSGGLCAAAIDGRHPGSEKRTPFTRPPRNRSWRPLDQRSMLDEMRARTSGKEEATGMPETTVPGFSRRRNTPLESAGRASK